MSRKEPLMPKNTAAFLSLATALALTLGACGGATTTAEEPPADQTPAVTKTPASSGSIDSQEALAIALQNAGLQESEVTVAEIGTETEDGTNAFDVKFNTNTMDYEYTVDANTGEILSSDIEYRD
jgi:uncharacterized membrane protein YkoI